MTALSRTDRPATLYCLAQVMKQLIERLTLRGATGNDRNLGPKSAFLGFVHNDFDIHV